MPESSQHLAQLRRELFDGGRQFSNDIQERLSAMQEAARELELALPESVATEDVPVLRASLVETILPAYERMARAILSPNELAGGFTTWIRHADMAAQSLPESIQEPEPERLYATSGADGALTMARKSAVRLVRRFKASDGPPDRIVPMKDLGLALTREWLPVQFGKVIDDDRQRIAQHAAQVEKSFSDFVHATLRAENRWRLTAEAPPRDDSLPPQYSDDSELEDALMLDVETPSQDDRDQVMERLERALAQLSKCLSEGSDQFVSAAAADVERRIEQAWIPLEAEVDRADSFMSAIPLVDDDLFSKRLSRIDADEGAWKEWKTRLAKRSAFLMALTSFKKDLDNLVDGMEEGVSNHLVQPIRHRTVAVAARLKETESDLAQQFGRSGDDLFDSKDGSLKALGEQAVKQVQEELVEPIQELSLLTRIPEENQAFLERLSGLIESLPEPFQMHPLATDAEAAIIPDLDARVVALKEVVRNGLAEIDEENLSSNTKEARDDLKETLEELVNLPSIVRFSFESATDSNQEQDDATDDDDSEGTDQLQTMMQESLQRTRDAIGTIGERIETSAAMLLHVYRIQTLQAWTKVQDRLQVEHQVGAYVMDVRSRLDAEAREAGQKLERLGRQLRILAERLFRRGHREARALIERGKEAVGTPSPTRASFHDTALGLADLEQVLEGVPAVYRKLFSFQPLSDPDLLIGRTESRTFIENQLYQFELGMPQAAVLVGGPSSGRTSLLNILQATEFTDRDVRVFRLLQRPESPAAMLDQLAQALDLPIPNVKDVPEAAAALLDVMEPENAPICIVEHLECLLLRGIGGYDLLVDMLQLMSLTDSRIIWIGTMSSFAWQLVKTADPDSAALVSEHAMTDLTREDLERLIMERHRKSGIPIEFVEPEEPSPLLRRKLKRVGSRDVRQQILKEAFFDRLFSNFGQNIQMALLQWIRSVTMSEDASAMRVSQTPPLNLSFFSGFNMDQVFTIKAILEHGSLSPNEYSRVDRLPEDKALTLFESLGNALVIETVERREAGRLYRHAAVEASKQYRIRPLFSHAVIRLLRERNVVH